MVLQAVFECMRCLSMLSTASLLNHCRPLVFALFQVPPQHSLIREAGERMQGKCSDSGSGHLREGGFIPIQDFIIPFSGLVAGYREFAACAVLNRDDG